ncbi:hypothetical protein [Megalodesulfovibrio gigas]|uniref:Uncharacterized protein n=1 Tax=Megalodesulfovibrio gigas (strain ATCC 19364 / DSM 1382 / NCIMB 9332 / VKM B-1759) TaxID=1121448 RepID=T2GB65_MEGG1|nr:hypothetical protein [Megalodesulfovibrio gigas]AGW13830.1 hypothetical protein DGI_2061 [Megalodesulfovibrio gigas DSM 1382 = ATCC 19364]
MISLTSILPLQARLVVLVILIAGAAFGGWEARRMFDEPTIIGLEAKAARAASVEALRTLDRLRMANATAAVQGQLAACLGRTAQIPRLLDRIASARKKPAVGSAAPVAAVPATEDPGFDHQVIIELLNEGAQGKVDQ